MLGISVETLLAVSHTRQTIYAMHHAVVSLDIGRDDVHVVHHDGRVCSDRETDGRAIVSSLGEEHERFERDGYLLLTAALDREHVDAFAAARC